MKFTVQKDEHLMDEQLYGAAVYRVIGMPEGQSATIESNTDGTWKVRLSNLSMSVRLAEEYFSPEDALVALQAAMSKPE